MLYMQRIKVVKLKQSATFLPKEPSTLPQDAGDWEMVLNIRHQSSAAAQPRLKRHTHQTDNSRRDLVSASQPKAQSNRSRPGAIRALLFQVTDRVQAHEGCRPLLKPGDNIRLWFAYTRMIQNDRNR